MREGAAYAGASLVRAVVAAFVCALPLASVAAKTLTEDDVSVAVSRIIAEGARDGVYTVHDEATGNELQLVFEDIRVVRGLPQFGWFPDIVFHDKDEPRKKYTVDFWLKPDGDALRLMDVRVHKDAKPDGESFMMITRSPLLWWWLPTLKRASAQSGVQAWQVMGAVHEHIIDAQKDGAYPLTLADGKTVPAELVAIHRPVGRAKGEARYFVCAELRNKVGADGSYSVDFEVAPDARSVKAGIARQIEIPRSGNGTAASHPLCRFEGKSFDVVE